LNQRSVAQVSGEDRFVEMTLVDVLVGGDDLEPALRPSSSSQWLPVGKPGAIIFDPLEVGRALIHDGQVAQREGVFPPLLADVDDDAVMIVHQADTDHFESIPGLQRTSILEFMHLRLEGEGQGILW
jgi:hypothetical protein